MPSLIYLTLLLILLQIPNSAVAVVYGRDSRLDLEDAPPDVRIVGTGAAIAVGRNLISRNADGTQKIESVFSFSDGICKDERFVGQTTLGICSGFLISDRLLVTAGHCGIPNGETSLPDHPFCKAISWYFGYETSKGISPNTDRISEDQIYNCKRLIRAENTEPETKSLRAGSDFMLIELDRPVASRFHRFPIAKDSVAPGDLVSTIGFPLGLPVKYSEPRPVLNTADANHFDVNLDSSSGNSGGVVLNKKLEVVGILVSGHPTDFWFDQQASCQRFNTCDADGQHCRADAPFPNQSSSNFVQKIEAIKPYTYKGS